MVDSQDDSSVASNSSSIETSASMKDAERKNEDLISLTGKDITGKNEKKYDSLEKMQRIERIRGQAEQVINNNANATLEKEHDYSIVGAPKNEFGTETVGRSQQTARGRISESSVDSTDSMSTNTKVEVQTNGASLDEILTTSAQMTNVLNSEEFKEGQANLKDSLENARTNETTGQERASAQALEAKDKGGFSR